MDIILSCWKTDMIDGVSAAAKLLWAVGGMEVVSSPVAGPLSFGESVTLA